MVNQLDDIICAISTPIGLGGIAIVRFSGKGCIDLCDAMFRGSSPLVEKKSHTINYGAVYDAQGNFIDEVLVSVMRSPHTYTKEDIVEINCHGGLLVAQRILEEGLRLGSRMAEPGEFTKRAFLNGRIDLSQAEAVIDMIEAKTELSRQAAASQLQGGLKEKVHQLREQVLDMVASIEAAIDYPEEHIEAETYETLEKNTKDLLCQMDRLLSAADQGKLIREGIEAAIIGKPNVGKSSFLNLLLKEERAIVTEIPGTTRDTVEEWVSIEGIGVKLIDTAGIRNTQDRVEQIGVEKSKNYAQKADLVLMMLDASRPLEQEDLEILEKIDPNRTIVLYNKIDLIQKADETKILSYIPKENFIPFSVAEQKGLEEFFKRFRELFSLGNLGQKESRLVTNTRHKNALLQAKEGLRRALESIHSHMPEDFISMDLQTTLLALGEITGETVDGEIIDRIFTRFCLGK